MQREDGEQRDAGSAGETDTLKRHEVAALLDAAMRDLVGRRDTDTPTAPVKID